MRKKLLSLTALLAVLSLSACGENTPASSSSESSSAISESSSESSSSSEAESSVSESSSSSESESSVSESSSSSESSLEAVTYEVQITSVDGVTVTSSVTEAKAGEEVTLTVTVTDSSLELVAVKVNGFALTFDGTGYSFIMPEGDAVVTVEVNKITYTVTNNASDYCYLVGLEEDYLAGDLVSFAVALKPGYYYTGVVEAYTLSGDSQNPVDLTKSGDSYSFTMPESNVFVNLVTETTSYQVEYEITGTTEEVDVYFRNSEGVNYTYNLVPTGSQIQLVVAIDDYYYSNPADAENAQHKISSIKFDGQELTLNDEGVYYVTMPSHPVKVEVVTELFYRNLTVTGTDNVSAFVATTSTATSEEAVTQLVANTKYYVHVASSNENYSLDAITASYVDSEGQTQSLTLSTSTSGSLYYFTCPVGDVTITLTEKDLSAYKNHAAVGTYVGFNLYGSTASNTSPSAKKQTISNNATASGAIKTGSWTIVDSNTISIDGKQVKHEGNALFAQYGSSNTDVYVFARAQSENDVLTAESCFQSSGPTWVTKLSLNGSLVTTIACLDNVVYLDVTIQMVEGTAINADSTFKVIKNKVELATIQKSGSTLTVTYPYHGTYTGSEGDLVLSSNAKLNGVEYQYTIDGNAVTLSSLSETYVIEIDITNKTYTITSHTANESNDFTGYTFVGTFYDSYWLSDNSLTITFGGGSQINGTIYVGSTSFYFDFTATLDGNTLTMTITSSIENTVIGKTLTATVSGKTITINNDINSTYPIGGATATCDSFPGLSA